MRRRTKFVIAVLVAIGAYACLKDDIAQIWNGLHVKLAEYPAPKNTKWLNQNVSDKDIGLFYHTDQGTRTFGIPFEWFMALEQPSLSPLSMFFSVDLFSDTAYLDRYGFIPDPFDKKALPVGFAHGDAMLDPTGEPWREPRYKKDMTGIGLTCAACHTGRFTYKDTTVIINGGPALTDLLKLKQGIGVALFETRFVPGRFGRFADRVLGSDSTNDERAALKFQIDQVLKSYNDTLALEKRVTSRSIEEGYGRLDALNRIGNQVFSIDLKNPDNYAGSSAPVHYPRIWNTPWFDWVQYNGSIMQPMVRNAGESLGVSSELNLTDPSKGLFKSSVNVDSLFWMEEMIKGKSPRNGPPTFCRLLTRSWPRRAPNSTSRIVRDVTVHRSRARPSTISTTRTGGGRTRTASTSWCSKTSRSSISAPILRRPRTWARGRSRFPPISESTRPDSRLRWAQWSRRPSTTSTTGRWTRTESRSRL